MRLEKRGVEEKMRGADKVGGERKGRKSKGKGRKEELF